MSETHHIASDESLSRLRKPSDEYQEMFYVWFWKLEMLICIVDNGQLRRPRQTNASPNVGSGIWYRNVFSLLLVWIIPPIAFLLSSIMKLKASYVPTSITILDEASSCFVVIYSTSRVSIYLFDEFKMIANFFFLLLFRCLLHMHFHRCWLPTSLQED